MTPYEHLLAKAEEIGWPAHYKTDLTTHDKEALEGCPDTMPFMWFVRECGTYLITPNGVGFNKYEGHGLLKSRTSPYATTHRCFLWSSGKLREIEPDQFNRTFDTFIINNHLPTYKVVVNTTWRPSPWALPQKEKTMHFVSWCKSQDALRDYIAMYLTKHKEHTIEIFSQVKEQEASYAHQ